jgi:hypothetical protein
VPNPLNGKSVTCAVLLRKKFRIGTSLPEGGSPDRVELLRIVEGFLVFVDAPKPGADPQALASALAIDTYRARALSMNAAPFLARGFVSLDAATRAATALDGAGYPASAHAGESLSSLPRPSEATAFSADANGFVFLLEGGARLAVAPALLRAIVVGKLQIRVDVADPPPLSRVVRGGLAGAILAGVEETTRSERAITQQRLELFVEQEGSSSPARIGLCHDRFDFSQLREKKSLSAVRNVDVLREALVRSATGVIADDAFARSEMSKGPMTSDVWTDWDLTRGAPVRQMPARSNRSAFDLYARGRFLHDLSRRRTRQDHYYEL